jgi:biotin carboxyl carrier protein
MQYFVTLDGQEFPLTAGRVDRSGRVRVGGSAGAQSGHETNDVGSPAGSTPMAFEAEVLSPAKHGRPALISVDGHVFRVLASAPAAAHGPRPITVNGRSIRVSLETEIERRARPIRDKSVARRATVVAPMPGRVVKLSVAVGDVVSVGTPLLGIEAMKMENELLSSASGRITKIGIQAGDNVEADQELLVIEPA